MIMIEGGPWLPGGAVGLTMAHSTRRNRHTALTQPCCVIDDSMADVAATPMSRSLPWLREAQAQALPPLGGRRSPLHRRRDHDLGRP